MEDKFRPDALEKKVRLGCCAFAGLMVGTFFGLFALELANAWLWMFAVITTVVFAMLALRYGDKFWLRLLEILHW